MFVVVVGDKIVCFFRGSCRGQSLPVTKLGAQAWHGQQEQKERSHSAATFLVSTHRFSMTFSVIWGVAALRKQPKSSLWRLCYDDTFDKLSLGN